MKDTHAAHIHTHTHRLHERTCTFACSHACNQSPRQVAVCMICTPSMCMFRVRTYIQRLKVVAWKMASNNIRTFIHMHCCPLSYVAHTILHTDSHLIGVVADGFM